MLTSHQLQYAMAPARPLLRRLIATTATTHEDLSHPLLRSFPKLSGSGPFALDPEFKLLGAPYPSALCVTLPSAGDLYVNSDHAAVTGITLSTYQSDQQAPQSLPQQQQQHSKVVQSTFGFLSNPASSSSKRTSLPFLYKKLSVPDQPATVLVASENPSSCLTTISPNNKFDWLVFQRRAILAWSGSRIKLCPEAAPAAAVAGAAIENIMRVSGAAGHVALASRSNSIIYEYKLAASEHIYLRPTSVLALTVPAASRHDNNTLTAATPTPSSSTLATDSFKIRHIYSISDLQLPPALERLLKAPAALLPSASTLDRIELLKDLRGYWANFKTYTSDLVSKYFWQDDTLLKVEGPAIVLVDTRHPSFAAEKINSLVNRV
ncbi:hypothetical protein DV495_000879 [Geotrichum candidum]|uniref:Uncharacterized protein n=1 Tax=Geotrichum candidum TaxID=1173061 RepID=A0A0J9XCT7_GEOCN|nr:hypothetical protein DV495_000879 [Geotrichum candidum]KAF7500333.1 hypothetical protein DV113_001624 [Geotrichum candidum]KAI8131304.1 hypothetical protein DUD61_005039 [Geotrichum candidum]CDO55082.1 conserved hypothetical protein [Geotrichum candidum]